MERPGAGRRLAGRSRPLINARGAAWPALADLDSPFVYEG